MNVNHHDFNALLGQLGLDQLGLQRIIDSHPLLPKHLALADAPCWSVSQAAFLREQLEADAEWSIAIDQLNLLLKQVH